MFVWPLKKEFILASASPRRLELLKTIGIIPKEIIPAKIDETPRAKETPKLYAKRMAEEKALCVHHLHPDVHVLAADTVVGVGRRILQKPISQEEALSHLKLLSGRRHRVYSGVCLVGPDGKFHTKIVTTMVVFGTLDGQSLKELIACDEWRDAAGSYKIQGLAGAFVREIVGSYSSVVGLPLRETLNLLRFHL